jgi:uncharacterized protein
MAKNNYHIYDAITNNIIDVNKDIYNQIELFIRQLNNGACLSGNHNIILSAIDSGIFLPIIHLEVDYPLSQKNYLHQLDNLIEQLVLCATESCNFRCKYCIYPGKYLTERKHSSQSMPFNIMMSSIDSLSSFKKNKGTYYIILRWRTFIGI